MARRCWSRGLREQALRKEIGKNERRKMQSYLHRVLERAGQYDIGAYRKVDLFDINNESSREVAGPLTSITRPRTWRMKPDHNNN